MGFQGGIDKERSFGAIVQQVLRFSGGEQPDHARGHHDRLELRGGASPAQHARGEQTNQGRQGRRAVEPRRGRHRGGEEAQSQQEKAEGHGCPMGEEGRREVFRLQEPHQGGQGEQVHQERGDHRCVCS